jgi:hypothetical protein
LDKLVALRDRQHPGTIEINDNDNDILAVATVIREAPANVTDRIQAGVASETYTCLFQEAGANTYTFDVLIPAGAIIQDLFVHNIALWTAATSAALEVGDFTNAATPVAVDADGFFTAVDLKATDLLAGESISLLGGGQGGVAGAYNAGTNTHWTRLYVATERIVRFEVVSVGAGTAGRTICGVTFCVPGETLVTLAS